MGETSKICLQSSCKTFGAQTALPRAVLLLWFFLTEILLSSHAKATSVLDKVKTPSCPQLSEPVSSGVPQLQGSNAEEDMVPTSSDKQCWNTFQRICLWCLWMVCLMLVQQPELCSMVGIQSCHSCKQAMKLTLPLQTCCLTIMLWKPLTWWDLWCHWICCKLILVLVHPIPRQSHTQWRKGQHLGTERPFQSCQSIGKKVLIFRLRQKLLLSSIPEFPFFPLVRQDLKKEKDASQASRW